MCKKMLRVQVQSAAKTPAVLFERLIDYDSSVSVPYDSLISSLDFLYSDVKHVVIFAVL